MSNPLAIASAAAGLPTTTALPIANETRAPAAVRDGSSTVKQAYATAQGFEEMLLQQLSQSLVQSSGLGGEGESGGEGSSGEEGASVGGEAGGGMLASLLPQTLTEGVMRQGGLGLATQLMDSLDPAAASSAATTAAASTTGAAVAPASATADTTGAAPASTVSAVGDATGGASAPTGAGSPAAVPAEAATTGGASA
jgi:Rod binding domain-containing protein